MDSGGFGGMDSGGFGWIRDGFGWIRVDSGGFGWIRDGFGWIRVDSGRFGVDSDVFCGFGCILGGGGGGGGWIRVVPCFSIYVLMQAQNAIVHAFTLLSNVVHVLPALTPRNISLESLYYSIFPLLYENWKVRSHLE